MAIYNLINPGMIIILGFVGILIGEKIPNKIHHRMLEGVAFSSMIIGISLALETKSISIMIFSIVLGAALGEWLGLDARLTGLGKKIQRRFALTGDTNFIAAFLSTSLLYSIGSMAILGPIQLGLEGNPDTLIVKATLDGISTLIFASTLGPGALFSAFTVFAYQTPIYLLSTQLAPYLQGDLIHNMTGVGGVLILMMSFDLLEIRKIPTANYIPAIFMPILIQGIIMWWPF